MSNEHIEKQYEDFKKNWKPSPELSEQAKQDEAAKRLDRASEAMTQATAKMSKQLVELNKSLAGFKESEQQIKRVEQAIREHRDEIISSNDRTQRWWEAKVGEMKSILMLAAQMGIEVDLSDKDSGGTPN